jgi:hypothetical protein
MSDQLTVQRRFHVKKRKSGQKTMRRGEPKPEPPRARVPRVAKLMALAIRFEELIRDGVVEDQAELARLGHVTRARMSQIMGLLNLAPDIQEAILFLPPTEAGCDRVSERELREVVGESDWTVQRRLWGRVAWGEAR